jgi:heavy metal translocating P-type ATPase
MGAGHTGRPWPGRAAAIYCCFGCLSLGEHRQQLRSRSGSSSAGAIDGTVVRLGIGILVVAQSMIFGLALNLHDDVPPSVRWLAETLILGATLLVMALLGGPLVRTAAQELRRGRLTIEALFLLTLGGAMAASLQAHLTGHGHIYFEVVSILLVVYTLGKLIGARSRAAALAESRAWADQLSTCRLVDEQGRVRTVAVTEIVPGDRVEVNPGETVPVDGVIRTGIGFLSESPISGEPFAVVRRPGDRVLAGTASHDATFQIEATTRGTERQVDRLLAAVEAARDRPVSLQAQADRLGRAFFPLVVLTALGTFAYWSVIASAGWEVALFNSMAVLLVACPCVIGLATPIVIWTAIGRLAERGLIVQAGDTVERLAEVDRVMLDKTGTLTDDQFALLDIVTVVSGPERAELLGWLAVIEARSSHPVARAFARLPRPMIEPRVLTVNIIPGCGVQAEIQVHGQKRTIQIGTPAWIGQVSTRTNPLPPWCPDLPPAAGHRIDVALDGQLVAAAMLAERLRDSTPQALTEFRRLGLPVEVLTGDTAERAASLNLPPTRARLLPDDKRSAVEAAQTAGGKPLFVGDGINDAAALAKAHAGIALAQGTDLAVGAAAAVLYHVDLRVIPWAIELSRQAIRSMRRNLYRALAYNIIGMTLAASGVLHPVVAALLMVVSSLSLIISSTRVGVGRQHCAPTEPINTLEDVPQRGWLSWPTRQAVVHAVALALQGVVALTLLHSLRELPTAVLVLAGFALAGVTLGAIWRRWSNMPHTMQMSVGMVTLGNLGMLLGWWADNGFGPLHDNGCCACARTLQTGILKPWMWLGMLTGANAAMLWLTRSKPRNWAHTFAMYTGGNLGMVLGMAAGGWYAGQFELDSVGRTAAASFAGMTGGMLAGMLLGTWVVEVVVRWLPRPGSLMRRCVGTRTRRSLTELEAATSTENSVGGFPGS